MHRSQESSRDTKEKTDFRKNIIAELEKRDETDRSKETKEYDSRLKPPSSKKSSDKDKGRDSERLKPPPKSSDKSDKKHFFSQEEQSQIGLISYDAQDDKLRDVCKAAIMSFKNSHNAKTMDLRKQMIQYEAVIQRYEAQYKAACEEIERIEKEKIITEEKTVAVREKLMSLFSILDASRAKRKERKEDDNLAEIVNAKKPKKEIAAEIERVNDHHEAILVAQIEIEKKKEERYTEVERLAEMVKGMQENVKMDCAMGNRVH